MKKVVLSVVALAAFVAPALAADMVTKGKVAPAPAPAAAPPPWDIAIGGVVMSDYNFRGVSQSNRGASGGAYFEPQFNSSIGTVYVGLAGYAIDWPSCFADCLPGYGFTNPSAEIDMYGGWRNTWGPLSLDLGVIYYYYPKEVFNGFTNDSDFYEFYAKASYAVTPALTIGGNIFYTPDLLNYSETFATGGITADAAATYASVTAKWVTPWTSGDLGAYISGELGHWWIDDKGWAAALLPDPSYTYYNVGLAFTYKALTLDLRYHGTSQSVAECNSFLLVGPGNRSSNWCNDAYIASLKFDTTLMALK
jgi:uncharacterized protein (TIGR02001 family)